MLRRNLPSIFQKPGWVEHDANEIWSTQLGVAVEAMSKIGASAGDIAAIGITNQRRQHCMDKATGEPIGPAIVWQCRRTAAYCDELKAKGLTELIRQKTGLVIDAYFLCYQAEMDPGSCARSQREGRAGRTAFLEPWKPGLSGSLQREPFM